MINLSESFLYIFLLLSDDWLTSWHWVAWLWFGKDVKGICHRALTFPLFVVRFAMLVYIMVASATPHSPAQYREGMAFIKLMTAHWMTVFMQMRHSQVMVTARRANIPTQIRIAVWYCVSDLAACMFWRIIGTLWAELISPFYLFVIHLQQK